MASNLHLSVVPAGAAQASLGAKKRQDLPK